MQKSYLVKQSVDFGQTSKFLIRPGDILVYDSANQNKVTVYRNGEIMKVLPNQSSGGLSGLSKSGWITEIHGNDSPKQAGVSTKTPPKAAGKPATGTPKAGAGQTTSTAAQAPVAAKKRVADSTV
jgi:hypothetical protein